MANTEKLQATLSSTAQLEGRVQNQTTLVGTAAVPYSVGGGSGGDSGGGVFTITAVLRDDGAVSSPDKTYADAVAAFEAGSMIFLRLSMIEALGYDAYIICIPFLFNPGENTLLGEQGFGFSGLAIDSAVAFLFKPDNTIEMVTQ